MDQDRVQRVIAKIANSSKKGLLPAWPRDEKELPQIELEVDWVRFSTLNHRTKAEQIRESLKRGNPNLFTEDPLGKAAQDAQYEILKSQLGFEDLRADLAERQQQDYAVVTAEGVLINGNRRAAALRSLFREDNNLNCQYVRCLVLPADATPSEILQLETELQIARDFKQEYSWVNQALLIEELYNKYGRDFDIVAKLMHRKAKDVRQDYDKVQQLNQLVALSAGTKLHVDFVPHETAFEELARYVRNRTDGEKESVRSVYFLGTLAGVNYRDLRNLARADAQEFVLREFQDEPLLSDLLESAEESQTTDEFDLLDDALGLQESKRPISDLLTLVARAPQHAPIKLSSGKEVDIADIHQQINRAITKAASEAMEQNKDSNIVSAPLQRLERAINECTRAIDALAQARAVPGWDEAQFQGRLTELRNLGDQMSAPD